MRELEDVIRDTNGHGIFQKRLLYAVLAPLYAFLALQALQKYIFLQPPDHWCYHPMAVNLTADELKNWKECYLPKKADNSYHTCKILLPNIPTRWSTTQFLSLENCPSEAFNAIKDDKRRKSILNSVRVASVDEAVNFVVENCDMKWMYDTSQFSKTLVTDLNWFCDKATNIPTVYTVSLVGGLLGGLLYNYLGDRFGRKYVFWCIVGLLILCNILKVFVTSNYYAFLVMILISDSTVMSIYQLPFSVISEISDEEFRPWAILISWVAW